MHKDGFACELSLQNFAITASFPPGRRGRSSVGGQARVHGAAPLSHATLDGDEAHASIRGSLIESTRSQERVVALLAQDRYDNAVPASGVRGGGVGSDASAFRRRHVPARLACQLKNPLCCSLWILANLGPWHI